MKPKVVKFYNMMDHGRVSKEYDSVSQAARLNGCDPKTIRNYANSGKRFLGTFKVRIF